jgi:hypothetical protein
VRGRGFYVVVFSLSSGVCGMKKRKDRSTEITIAFATIGLVAAILIV